VNWAKATTLIAREEARIEKTKLMKSGFANLFGRGGREGSNKFEHKFCKSEPSVVDVLESDVTMCSYGVSIIDVTRVEEVYFLVQDLLKQCKSKIINQELKRTKFFEKLVGLKFSMEDRRATTLDA
jgi:hypothetical protein